MGLAGDDLAAKRKKMVEDIQVENLATPVSSRFFGGNAIAGPSRIRATPKDDGILETQEVVLVRDSDDDVEVEEVDATDEEPDQVTQEDGYLSPAASMKRLSTPDLSSPPRQARPPRGVRRSSSTQEFGADILSSPETGRRTVPSYPKRSKSFSNGRAEVGRILVPDTPQKSRSGHAQDDDDTAILRGPKLFSDVTGVDLDDVACIAPPCSFGGSTQSSSGPETPMSQPEIASLVASVEISDDEVELDDEVEILGVRQASQDAVAQGWWSKWARGGAATGGDSQQGDHGRAKSLLRRRETTVTPEGVHKALRFREDAKTTKSTAANLKTARQRGSSRKSLTFSASTSRIESVQRRRSTGTSVSGMMLAS
ncbi:hypothetical protein BC834DRAFT_132412 [Gloeopeniophorella convolvens]|nr:hypothetical protein BC834DRAFT_132412 [Gloeopeniophorella convolvens]